MIFFVRNLIILTLTFGFLGCESKTSYDIKSDRAVADLTKRINSFQEDLDKIDTELKEVEEVLEDGDIDTELKKSIKKEIHEGERYKKQIEQWIAYFKVQRKQRYHSLVKRKGEMGLKKEAEEEVKDYFSQKKLNPIPRPWKKRYRTAIEL